MRRINYCEDLGKRAQRLAGNFFPGSEPFAQKNGGKKFAQIYLAAQKI